MPTSTEAVVLHAAKSLRLEQIAVPEPGPEELQIAIHSTTLCGSDLHYYQHFANGDINVKEPIILGHESAGIVVEVGSSVANFAIGDRVALEVGIPCGSCKRCNEGRYNICAAMRFRSSAKSFPHFQGTLQRRLNHPASWCHKLPASLTLDEGALLEPLSVALQALRRAKLQPGASALVIGAGAIGLLIANCLTVEGIEVTIADVNGARVDFAKRSGFARLAYAVPLRRGASVQEKLDIAKEDAATLNSLLQSQDQDAEFDATFECTGVESCSQTAIYATRAGGKVVLVGMGTPIQTLPISSAALREVDLVGVFRYTDTYPTGIAMLEERRLLGIEKLVTHRFVGLQEAENAFLMAGRTADNNGQLVLKTLIDTSKS